ncbi:unnamed protein product, partial [Iphiclides podalirius]
MQRKFKAERFEIGLTKPQRPVDSKQIVSSLRTVFTAEYLDRLADIISKKAAKTFVAEVLKNIPQAPVASFQSGQAKQREAGRIRKEMNTIDEREAMRLLETPSPDGDNLDENSAGLSDEQSYNTNRVPLIGLTKINGVYYRRFLGLI